MAFYTLPVFFAGSGTFSHPSVSRPRGGHLQLAREAPPSSWPIARSSWP